MKEIKRYEKVNWMCRQGRTEEYVLYTDHLDAIEEERKMIAKLKHHLHMAYLIIANEFGRSPEGVDNFLDAHAIDYVPSEKPCCYKEMTGADHLRYIEENY